MEAIYLLIGLVAIYLAARVVSKAYFEELTRHNKRLAKGVQQWHERNDQHPVDLDLGPVEEVNGESTENGDDPPSGESSNTRPPVGTK